MATLSFSSRAEDDLFEIGVHTVRSWGEEQYERYTSELEKCLGRLSHNPEIGRRCTQIDADLLRIECARHVIFYRHQAGVIRVVRILHRRMLPSPQFFD